MTQPIKKLSSTDMLYILKRELERASMQRDYYGMEEAVRFSLTLLYDYLQTGPEPEEVETV